MKSTHRILALVLLLGILGTSCGNAGGEKEEETASAVVNSPETEAALEPETETKEPAPDIEGLDYNGGDLTFIAPYFHTISYQYAEELNGDALNDAAYNRWITVESDLNASLHWVWHTDGSGTHTEVLRSVQAGDDAYQIVYMHSMYGISDYVISGSLYNLDLLPHVDFKAPWWSGEMMENFRIGKNLDYAAGDLCLQSPIGIIFNKTIAANYNLPDHYEMVRNGEWTYDRFIQYGSAVTLDMNGDAVIDYRDQTGYTGDITERACDIPFFCGEHLTKATDEGLELVFWSDRMVELFEKTNAYFMNTDVSNAFFRAAAKHQQSFDEGLALYSLVDISYIVHLRDSDVEFGILPGFKYDEQQERYYSYAWPLFVCVPITIGNPDMTGAVLEYFCYLSGDIQTAYNENLIRGKSTRDEESLEMLNIINAGLVSDIGGSYLGFESSFNPIFYCFTRLMSTRQDDIASFYAKSERAALNSLVQLYDKVIAAEEKNN